MCEVLVRGELRFKSEFRLVKDFRFMSEFLTNEYSPGMLLPDF